MLYCWNLQFFIFIFIYAVAKLVVISYFLPQHPYLQLAFSSGSMEPIATRIRETRGKDVLEYLKT